MAMPAEHIAYKTIAETATDASLFSTLVGALKEADLVELLSGRGPFTVFAPTDEVLRQAVRRL